MIYLRARYYDPELGRFISRDPVRGTLDNPLSQNPYQYALDNPVRYSDPSGEFVWDVIDAGFFALSLKEFSDCPGLGSGAQLAADTLSLLPGIPSIGYLTRGGDALDIVIKHDHASKHLGGISSEAIDSAIRSDIANKGAGDVGQTLERFIFVGGQLLEYRVHKVNEDLINVGTYFFVK